MLDARSVVEIFIFVSSEKCTQVEAVPAEAVGIHTDGNILPFVLMDSDTSNYTSQDWP
jgi:hypothetical protein